MRYFPLFTIIILVFYLYLLVRPQYIQRKGCFLIGCAGLLLALVGALLTVCGVYIVGGIFDWIGAIVAFLAAVATCYGGDLPCADKINKVVGTCTERQQE